MSANGLMSPPTATGDMIPRFALSEITVGRLVGQGGFSVVCKIESIEMEEVYDTGEQESKVRAAFASSIRRGENNQHHYVMKSLRHDLPEEEYVKGIVDLAIEAEFLSVVSHPNIISMRAMANSDPHESKFFVILDRLVSTLDRKFNHWRKSVGENSGMWWLGPFGYCCAKEHFLYQTWVERICAARDVANAIYYLHSNAIIYRDLKPDNLGFDALGNLKLFDFGLAKRLDPELKTHDGVYFLTGNTGSLRYMAPEVAIGEPYNQRVDTYSFGILLWQICSLQTPFAGFSTLMHAEQVVRQGHRPRVEMAWPESWSAMMNRAWHPDWRSRPDFDEIAVFMDEQVDALQNNEGQVPSRTTFAKKKKTDTVAGARLDVDTRISCSTTNDGDDEVTSKRFDTEIV